MLLKNTSIRLPSVISDGMVLQRDSQVKLWGWAPALEELTIFFADKVYQTTASAEGEWQLSITTEAAGGPYDLRIEGENGKESILIKDILLGDVWICSGQSNMDMRMFALKDTFPEEFTNASHDKIRQFSVPVKYNFEHPQQELEGGSWEKVTPQSILNFSAAAYFMAKELYESYQVPIGLINASLGGSPAEAWMSREALREFPEYLDTAKRFQDIDYQEQVLKNNQACQEEWNRVVSERDIGLQNPELPFYHPEYDASDWREIRVPSLWEEEGLGVFQGAVWFRKEIEIPSGIDFSEAKLVLGHIIEEDTTYINGIKVGSLPMQYIPRYYDIPEGVLKEGKNILVIRASCNSGMGGFYKTKPYYLQLGDRRIDLTGFWQCKVGARSEAIQAPVFVSWLPTGLYHSMIAPLHRYAIKGALWYQGETNAQKPENYEDLLKNLITDWRRKWDLGDFPFLIVQLPNFMEPLRSPAARNWADIREAQRKVLALPNTGLAITIDLGEWNDVHPKNKKGVGHRLALLAHRLAYGNSSIVASGPLLQSARREGAKIRLDYTEIGSGLTTKDGCLPQYFEIAGADHRYLWAEACIVEDHVMIWHNHLTEPRYVRYAWSDNPEGANLCNKEGLPASPFAIDLS
jgi:sialate O-acetylesterase